MTRILVVDDEPQILRVLRINLVARQYEVVTAATGGQALTAARSEHPDLVILDLGLPDVDGVVVIGRYTVDLGLHTVRLTTPEPVTTEAGLAPAPVPEPVGPPRPGLEPAGSDVHLTRTEWQLLEAVVSQPGKLVGQRYLLEKVWGPTYHAETQYVRQYMAQLRRKLETDPARPRHLLTEPGMGYRFQP